jgi:hypothetical protein
MGRDSAGRGQGLGREMADPAIQPHEQQQRQESDQGHPVRAAAGLLQGRKQDEEC